MMRKYFIYSLIACGSVVSIFFVVKNILAQNKPLVVDVVSSVSSTPTLPTIKPFVILVVPGHDTDTDCNTDPKCNSGAVFNNVRERDLVVGVAQDISALLGNDPKYKVIVARDTVSWNPIFVNYFANNQQAILDFKNQHQAADKLLIASGQEKVIPDAANHTTANAKTAIELYGINKWADENNVDLVIHLHFNSSGRSNMGVPGKNHGFNIFIPNDQRTIAPASRTVAEDIYTQLQKTFNPETPGSHYESLHQDQSLIALGASNTLTKPALLIEYAYIYEKMLQTDASRKQTLELMAEETVAGVESYADSINNK